MAGRVVSDERSSTPMANGLSGAVDRLRRRRGRDARDCVVASNSSKSSNPLHIKQAAVIARRFGFQTWTACQGSRRKYSTDLAPAEERIGRLALVVAWLRHALAIAGLTAPARSRRRGDQALRRSL